MSLDIGFDAQAPSLPKGGGAVSGLGETFAPDLSTGTGTYTVPLDLPNGPNDIGPRLVLRYDTAQGSGPFGLGFTVPLPRIVRSVADRFPRYDDTDQLTLEGAGELLDLGGGDRRPQVDGGAWRIQGSGDGFRLTDREGLFHFLGTTADGRLSDAGGAGSGAGSGPVRVFAWHLERIEDPLGNAATFTWIRDGSQLYLGSVAYGAYDVRFEYEDRPDPIRWGRCGFQVTTNLRCRAIELRLPADLQPLLRRWTLAYTQDEWNGVSLLSRITLSGFDEALRQLDAPPLAMGYTRCSDPTLDRCSAVDEGAPPPPLTPVGRRVELVDWNGIGLPDLLEIGGGGRARRWPNAGSLTWGRPESAGTLPLFATPAAAVAFADMDGDGSADLIRADRPLDGYIPRDFAEGFSVPVRWPLAPAATPLGADTRLVDLDGDGVVDLLRSSDHALTLAYRDMRNGGGWVPTPQVVPRDEGPDVSLSDPHVFVADMTGDGTPDLVRVDGAGVTYWPYLGLGRWAQPVQMQAPPELPFDLRPERLILADLDGDGCADLVYLDQGLVRFWSNQGGDRFGPDREIDFIPAARMSDARVADVTGSGTAGILWSMPGPLGGAAGYFFLDFTGGRKPHLLETIDPGLGETTTISYSTSPRQALLDQGEGHPWASRLPVAIPVVEAIRTADAVTGRSSATTYRYHEGRYDGILREFAGFGRVDEDQIGDATAPTLRTTTWFHTGLQPDSQAQPASRQDRMRWRAVRGRLHRQERYRLDGSGAAGLPFDRLDQRWQVDAEATAAGEVEIPRLVSATRMIFEGLPTPAGTLTTTNESWDRAGNITSSVETSEVPGHPERTLTLRTSTSFAADPSERFVARAWRVRQSDGAGAVVADTVTEYDGMPEGQIGAQGLVTRRSALVFTDALVEDAYRGSAPDLASLGYLRRTGEDGWWIRQASYRRTDDADGLRGEVTGPMGAVTTFEFDANRTYPVRVTDPRGNVVVTEHDYRACRVSRLTDASGAVYAATSDALARPVATVEPGDSVLMPTVAYRYQTATQPAEVTMQRRANSGQAATIDLRELFDGGGRLLERRVSDDAGEIVSESFTYSSRGFVAETFPAHRPASAAYAPPAAADPRSTFTYDALGRPVRQQGPDGSFRTFAYGPLTVEESDEEDTRTDQDASHAATPTRKLADPTGRIIAVEQNLEGRVLRSTSEHDVKGDLVRHLDPVGNEVRISYDLLGRTIAVRRPEHSTMSMFDAAGNAVEARGPTGTLVTREFDDCRRPTVVRFGGATSQPVMRFTYHDAGEPAPPDAGAHTVGGHCVRIDDQGGATVFDYDERGRIVRKRSTPVGQVQTFDLELSYRTDGQLASVTYPNDGTGRRVLRYEYDERGNVRRIPSVITQMDYDLSGRRSRVMYASGVAEVLTHDLDTGRLTSMELLDPGGGALRSTTLTTDRVGNLIRLDSSDPDLAFRYTYDDLYRLVGAAAGTGETWGYRYDDGGAISHKSDVGDYAYGEGGAPATCLTTAGPDRFTYSPLGEMQETPWGSLTFDAMGRLTDLRRPGGSEVRFRYDYAGERVAVETTDPGGPSTLLTPDALYELREGTLVANVFDGESLAARLTPAGVLYLHRDHLGGLAAVTDAAGTLVQSLRYDPYGAVLERTGQEPPLPVGFTGGVPEPLSGLLYLGARYYHPGIGRFISPDPVVQDVHDPIAWSSYVYCRDNPASYIDPTGRGFWGIFLASLAIVALVVLMVCGVGEVALAAVIVGMVVGGLVGGLAAAAKGGDTEDIVTGVFVGAAVGGWGAYLSVFAGAGASSALGINGTFIGTVTAGAINGTINGAAIGFAAGYAGGKGSLDEVWTQTWHGALVGAVAGAILGGLSYALKPPSASVGSDVGKALKPQTPIEGTPIPGTPSTQTPLVPTSGTQSFQGAGGSVLSQIASKVGGVIAKHILPYVLQNPAGQALIVDAAAGAWDLGYVPWLLNKIGVVSV